MVEEVAAMRIRPALVVLVAALTVGASGAGAVLDPTFGGDGRVRTRFPGGAYATDVAVVPAGGLVAVGAAAGPDDDGVFAVARYRNDGGLLTGFGDGGRVVTAVSSGGDVANAVATSPGGRIVVAGTAGRDAFAVVRYLPDGSLDPGFGGDGIVRTDVTPDRFDIAYDVTVLDDGRVVVAGSTGTRRPRFALVRYRADGHRDRSFGGDGIVVTPMGVWGQALAMAVQSNGRMVLAGTDGAGGALARYLPDGSLDPSFGRGGVVRGAWRLAWFRAVAIGPDGSIVVGGDRDIFATALARFTPHGRPDPSFGGDGRVVLDLGTSEEAAVGVDVLAGGAVVGAGYTGPHESVEEEPFRFTAFRLRADGRLDPRFGDDGVEVTRFGDGALAMGATLGRGKLVVAGAAGWPRAEGFALVRYRI
jgi:uncharacterized delta-60 repeat protein